MLQINMRCFSIKNRCVSVQVGGGYLVKREIHYTLRR